MGSPALTLEASAVLVTAMDAQLTVIATGPAEAEPSLVVVTEAVLLTVGHVALVVGEVMWTWTDPDAARSAGPYTRWPEPLMENPALEFAWSMDQDRPALAGRGSSTVRLRAIPDPTLLTVTTNPIVSPALTGEVSEVLEMMTVAQLTVTEAWL